MDNELKTEESVSENVAPADDSTVSSSDNKLETKESVSENVAPADDSTVSNGGNETKPEKKSEVKESLESILRKFKRQSSGIVAEIKKREAYDKPSVRRKKKSKEARRRKNGKFGLSRW